MSDSELVERKDTRTAKGYGVFAKVDLDCGTDVWTELIDETEFNSDEIANMTAEQRKCLYHFGTVKAFGVVSVAPCIEPYIKGKTNSIVHEELEVGLFINHSCEPNLVWKDDKTLTTWRCVKAGEELTYDYGTEDLEVNAFQCLCGAVKCRGVIEGQEWKKTEMQEKYGKCFQTPILKAMGKMCNT